MFLCAVSAAALLLAATGVAAAQQESTRTATFAERFKPAMETEVVVESTPFQAAGDALKAVSVVLKIVDKLSSSPNQRLADLRAFAHTGGDWETLTLWTVPANAWPVITAVSDEYHTADMMAVGWLGSSAPAKPQKK
ncbi:MAG: hypothetical protein Q7R90_03330 [bacterium]|nr:hypothetical protein [bacterium]